jgi:hypothetical protein
LNSVCCTNHSLQTRHAQFLSELHKKAGFVVQACGGQVNLGEQAVQEKSSLGLSPISATAKARSAKVFAI